MQAAATGKGKPKVSPARAAPAPRGSVSACIASRVSTRAGRTVLPLPHTESPAVASAGNASKEEGSSQPARAPLKKVKLSDKLDLPLDELIRDAKSETDLAADALSTVDGTPRRQEWSDSDSDVMLTAAPVEPVPVEAGPSKQEADELKHVCSKPEAIEQRSGDPCSAPSQLKLEELRKKLQEVKTRQAKSSSLAPLEIISDASDEQSGETRGHRSRQRKGSKRSGARHRSRTPRRLGPSAAASQRPHPRPSDSALQRPHPHPSNAASQHPHSRPSETFMQHPHPHPSDVAPRQAYPLHPAGCHFQNPAHASSSMRQGCVTQFWPDQRAGWIQSEGVHGLLPFQLHHPPHPAVDPVSGSLVNFYLIPEPNGLFRAVDVRLADPGQVLAASRAAAPMVDVPRDEIMAARYFLQRHACRNLEQPYTHSSMMGGRDALAPKSGRFCFGDDRETQTQLAKAIATFYLHNKSKLYLTEHPSEAYAFVEDIDVEGTRGTGTPSIMRPKDGDLEFLKWRATILRKLFPTANLRCGLYEASGWYSGSQLYKESYHIIWHDLIVRKEQAVLIRQASVEFFEQESAKPNHPLMFMLDKARHFNSYNTWDTIFDATTTRPKVGLRLPYSDKRSRLENDWMDENRPVQPVAEIVFEFEKSNLDSSVEICTKALQVERVERKAQWEWALLGMCRRPNGTKETYFRSPKLLRPPIPKSTGNRRRTPGSGSSRHLKGRPRILTPAARLAPAASSAPARRVPIVAPGGQLKPSRLFRGSRQDFVEACHRVKPASATVEVRNIQGGVMVKFGSLGNVNFLEKSSSVVIQGSDISKLEQLVETWTEKV
eukprot:TRINITY_DN41590_c0_g1_i1.p1 TRINITY_DN41590_c0_g1~~TRINITY_DN41590_c0_g1_i1.p1  ORF type:complete len:830 (-),score=86.74 TRINITY_DN41590_c0_g1_i1:72-2561(-)